MRFKVVNLCTTEFTMYWFRAGATEWRRRQRLRRAFNRDEGVAPTTSCNFQGFIVNSQQAIICPLELISKAR